MAYPLAITHHASAGENPDMSTVVNLSFIRSMPEFIGHLGEGLSPFTSIPPQLDIYPPEPIEEVSDAFQRTTAASTLYKRMLYRNEQLNRTAAFDWRAIFNVIDSDGLLVDTVGEVWKLKEDISLIPKDGFQSLFNSRTAAMQYAARPVCTLQEYIEIWHGRTMKELLADNTVRGEYTSFYSPSNDKTASKGAIFWGRIYKFVQGPGDVPPVEASNIGEAPEYSSAGDGNTTPVGTTTGMPDTRKDWDTILEKYRKIVRSELNKISPQQ